MTTGVRDTILPFALDSSTASLTLTRSASARIATAFAAGSPANRRRIQNPIFVASAKRWRYSPLLWPSARASKRSMMPNRASASNELAGGDAVRTRRPRYSIAMGSHHSVLSDVRSASARKPPAARMVSSIRRPMVPP